MCVSNLSIGPNAVKCDVNFFCSENSGYCEHVKTQSRRVKIRRRLNVLLFETCVSSFHVCGIWTYVCVI